MLVNLVSITCKVTESLPKLGLGYGPTVPSDVKQINFSENGASTVNHAAPDFNQDGI